MTDKDVIKAEVEELSEVLSDSIRIKYKEAKSEAVKEFAERLKERLTGIGRSTTYGNFECGFVEA